MTSSPSPASFLWVSMILYGGDPSGGRGLAGAAQAGGPRPCGSGRRIPGSGSGPSIHQFSDGGMVASCIHQLRAKTSQDCLWPCRKTTWPPRRGRAHGDEVFWYQDWAWIRLSGAFLANSQSWRQPRQPTLAVPINSRKETDTGYPGSGQPAQDHLTSHQTDTSHQSA